MRTPVTTWVNPENMMLSERSLTQRPRNVMHLYEMPRIGKSIRAESTFAGMWIVCLMGRAFPPGEMKMFWN